MLNKLLDFNDLDIYNNWGEYFIYLAGIVGFMISLVYFNLLFNLISIFVLGFVAARIHFFKSKEVPILPFSLNINARYNLVKDIAPDKDGFLTISVGAAFAI